MTKELEAKEKTIKNLERENKLLVEMNQILREGVRRNKAEKEGKREDNKSDLDIGKHHENKATTEGRRSSRTSGRENKTSIFELSPSTKEAA